MVMYSRCFIHSNLQIRVTQAGGITIFIKFIFLNKLKGIILRHVFFLFSQQEVEQVSGAHETIRLCILSIDDINLLSLCQNFIEMLNLLALQESALWFVTFLKERKQVFLVKSCVGDTLRYNLLLTWTYTSKAFNNLG